MYESLDRQNLGVKTHHKINLPVILVLLSGAGFWAVLFYEIFKVVAR
jgi:hypothetical protein